MTFLNRHRSRIRPVGPFAPSSLFFGGIPGAWYDPTDLSTMFQDSTGTTPVTAVEQPVGLILDKSQGLVIGNNIVTNPGPFTGTTGWTASGDASLSAVNGRLRVTLGTQNYQYGWQTLTTVPGRAYRITYTAYMGTAGAVRLAVGSTGAGSNNIINPPTQTVSGVASYVFFALGASTTISLYVDTTNDNVYAEFEDISVRELAGNHASQSSNPSRPTYRARYNLLTFSEQFDNAAWNKANASATPDATTAPDGTTTADKLVENAASAVHAFFQNATIVAGSVYTASVYIKAAGRNFAQLRYENSGASTMFAVSVNLTTGATSTVSFGSPTNTSFSVVAVGSGWWRVTIAATATNTLWSVQIFAQDTLGNNSYLGNGTDGIFIWGAQLLTAADVTATGNAYQRIAAATVYDTAPIFRPYLAFDGLDDSLATAAINFTATDKMSVFSGLSRFTDAGAGMFAELSANWNVNNGSFVMVAPDNPNFYAIASRGGVPPVAGQFASTAAAAYAAPNTAVLTGTFNISGDATVLRLNGASISTGTADQGAGNFGNYPLFIGRRNNASLPFNGRIYELIVRGAASSVTEIADTELWVNARTGAF